MNRAQRVLAAAQTCREIMRDNTKWVKVQVAPAHECQAPFVTLDPLASAHLRDRLDIIEREMREERTDRG